MTNQFEAGSNHWNWRGGRYVDKEGYSRILVGTNRYEKEHIVIMEWYLERKLEIGECVHHINGNRQDNRLENLELMLRSKHSKFHQTGLTASEETKLKLRKIRKGTNQKEFHPQWKKEITKQKLLAALNKHKTQKKAAKSLGICPDTFRERLKHYGIYKIIWT